MPDFTVKVDATTGKEKLVTEATSNPSQLTATAGTGGWSPGTPVYASAAGEMTAARANAAGTSSVQGLGLAAVSATSDGLVQTDGPVTLTDTQWQAITEAGVSLVAGTTYLLSITTAGKLQTEAEWAAAATSGATRTVIGTAHSTTVLKLEIGEPVAIA